MIPNTSVSGNRRYSLFSKQPTSASSSSSSSAVQEDHQDATKSKRLPFKRATNETGPMCQRCMAYEVDLTDTSDVLTATDAELRASRQVISLLQRQLELVRVEKEGLEKLIVAHQSPISQLVDKTVHSNDLADAETEQDGSQASSDENKLLKLIRNELYAKDEQIVKLNSSLKESENEIKQLKLQIHFVEEENTNLKTENSVLAENVALRDQTIVSLSNEVFEQENLNELNKPITRRQSMSAELFENQQSALKTQKHIAKLIDSLDAYKKTNELLSNNVMRLTERCNNMENKELEARSQCQELEAKCCQIQSKLLSLLKEIEQASQSSDGNTSTTTADSPGLICSEPVKLLIKRLLEDKSLDIPLSWKEGNRPSHTKATEDARSLAAGKHECDELGFYIVKDEKIEDPQSSPRNNKPPPLRRAYTTTSAYSPTSHAQSSPSTKLDTLDELVEECSSDNNKRDVSRQISVDATKNDEADWHLRWDEFIKNFDKIDLAKSKEFKDLLRSGVPQEYRCKVWKSLVDLRIGDKRRKHGSEYYQSLLEPDNKPASSNNNKRTLNPSSKQIELDLLRTLPNNKHFEMLDSPGTVRLRKVLTAYSNHNPTVGYCQGMNRLAAVALLVLPEEEAFWCLSAIVDNIMPQGYYNDLWLAQVDSSVVMDLVSIKMPRLSAHFKSNGIELSLFAWFLTIFVDGTSPALFLRLWDSFLYEGDKILFRIALALLHISERHLLKLNSSVAINNFIRVAANTLTDIDKFFEIAFVWMNPLSAKTIVAKRQHHFHLTKSALGADDKLEKTPIQDNKRTEETDYESPLEDSSVISV